MVYRTPQIHPKYFYLEELLSRERSGYFGETQMHFPLSKLNFPFYGLWNIRLPLNFNFFQIDTVLITLRYVVTLEAKNYTGEVTFSKDFNQVVQRKTDENNVYPDPVLQAQEQKFQLEMWLEQHDFPRIPIIPLVVMTNPRAILKTPDADYYKKRIITLPRLSSKLREVDQYFSKEVITMAQARSIGELMLQENTPYIPDIFKKTKIKPEEIGIGFICYKCGAFPMKRIKRSWECFSCGDRSQKAYINGLKDYFLLFGNKITNNQFRWFAGIDSASSIKYMINSMGFKPVGYKRAVIMS